MNTYHSRLLGATVKATPTHPAGILNKITDDFGVLLNDYLTILFYIQHAIGGRVVSTWFFPGSTKKNKKKNNLVRFFPFSSLGHGEL